MKNYPRGFIPDMTDGGRAVRCSTRFKFYGDELVEIMIADKCIFCPDGGLKAPGHGKKSDFVISAEEAESSEKSDDTGEALRRSKSRARKMVFDLVACNPELDTFLTFTLNGELIDRYDYSAAIKKLNTWLDNRVRRRGLRYVFVAEHHKDGAIHFHGLANSSALSLTPSGVKDKRGNDVYNVTDWRLGFTTAIKCYGERGAVCKYVTKYISKSTEKVGGRWYYSGGALARPRYEYTGRTTPEEFTGMGFDLWEKDIPEARMSLKILTKRL